MALHTHVNKITKIKQHLKLDDFDLIKGRIGNRLDYTNRI